MAKIANYKKGTPHVPTSESRALVLALAISGAGHKQICAVVGISYRTMRKYYAPEVDKGLDRANSVVAAKLYGLCREGNLTALIFWAKTRMGWRETDRGDVNVAVQVNSGRGTDDVERLLVEIEANIKTLPTNDTQVE